VFDNWKLKSDPYELVRFGVSPHAPYTVCDDSWKKAHALAAEYKIKVHTHLHETHGEVHDSECGIKTSMNCHRSESLLRPFVNLDKQGLLGKDTIAAHMVHLTDEEISRAAELNVSVAHCPSSNMKLASGFCEVSKLLNAGVNVAIGTDGASSNNSLNMIGEMKFAALLAKGVAKDATACPAATALRMATLNGAKALGIQDITGSIEVGKYADVVAIDLDDAEMLPVFDVISHLVYANSRDRVSDVWVAGAHLLRSRELYSKGLNEREIREKARVWQSKIAASKS
jgi:5-methylthioadenosine/S-adenosylhomocysteine deaminase